MADASTAPDIVASELEQVRMYGEKEGDPKSLVRIPGSILLSLLTAAAQGFRRFATEAARNADTSQAAGTLAYVYLNNGDPADPANGWSQWNGSAWTAASWISNDLVAVVQPLVDQAEAWAEGTLPGGAGTKSAKEHGVAAAASAASAALVAAGLSSVIVSDPMDPNRYIDFVDDNDNVFYRIQEGDPSPGELDAWTKAAQEGLDRETLAPAGFDLEDESGDRIGRITGDDIEHRKIEAMDAAIANAKIRAWAALVKMTGPVTVTTVIRTMVWHIMKAGQSNSVNDADTLGLPPYPPPLFMFNGGVHTRRGFSPTDTTTITGSTRTSFVAMQETGSETGMGVALSTMLHLAKAAGFDLSNSDIKMLGSSWGVGGQTIEQIRSTYFFRGVEDMTEARAIANAANQSYSVGALLYNGHESNQANTAPVGGVSTATTIANFLAQLRQVQSDFQASAQSISGQNWPVPMFIVQTNSHLSTGSGNYTNVNAVVARAQIEAGRNADNVNDNIIFCGPSYQFEKESNPAGVHFSMVGGAVRDALIGVAMFKYFFLGVKQQPLVPVITRYGDYLRLRFPLDPGRAFVWEPDPRIVPPQTNFGFRVFDAGMTPQTIDGVRIIAANEVEIAPAATPAAGWIVDHAIASSTGGPRGLGQLRDNQGDDIVDPVFGYPVHNFIPAFRETVQ